MNRRSFITGAALLVAAPAIVRVSSLMPVKALSPTWGIDLASGPDITATFVGFGHKYEVTGVSAETPLTVDDIRAVIRRMREAQALRDGNEKWLGDLWVRQACGLHSNPPLETGSGGHLLRLGRTKV